MNTNFPFTLAEKAPEALKDLLHHTTYGTDGACYRHLDTLERIEALDFPLHFMLKRNERILGNCTFCRRDGHWYIRFFSFAEQFRGKGKVKEQTGNSFLRNALASFFDSGLKEGFQDEIIKDYYAYIEPKNKRSIAFSSQFNFYHQSTILTQTFSRVYPKLSPRFRKIDKWESVQSFIEESYADHAYYFDYYLKQGPFFGLFSDKNELLACCKFNQATWEIVQLPGKNGKFLTKVIPYIPFLNKIIQPKSHTFIAPEAVWCKNNDANLLHELFESLLAFHQMHLILWWIDENESIYQIGKDSIHWGILHKIVGTTPVHVMRKSLEEPHQKLHFVSCQDMI